jgi:sulfur carrier protein
MKLTINGVDREIRCDKISQLLNILKLNLDSVAVELNKAIVHRENYFTTSLKQGDKLEIVSVVGGG